MAAYKDQIRAIFHFRFLMETLIKIILISWGKPCSFSRNIVINYFSFKINIYTINIKTKVIFFCLIFLLSISFKLYRRVDRSAWNKGQWRKKWDVVSISRPQLQRGFQVPWKLCLNLCSLRWLRPSLNLDTNLIPFSLWYWKFDYGKVL